MPRQVYTGSVKKRYSDVEIKLRVEDSTNSKKLDNFKQILDDNLRRTTDDIHKQKPITALSLNKNCTPLQFSEKSKNFIDNLKQKFNHRYYDTSKIKSSNNISSDRERE